MSSILLIMNRSHTGCVTIQLRRREPQSSTPYPISLMQAAVTSVGLPTSTLIGLRPAYQTHPHHLTLESPWPILTSGSILAMLSSAALYFNSLDGAGVLLCLGLLSTSTAIALWWADCVIEGTYLGHHTKVVQHSLSLGVSLFVVTEACFFLSIFWASHIGSTRRYYSHQLYAVAIAHHPPSLIIPHTGCVVDHM